MKNFTLYIKLLKQKAILVAILVSTSFITAQITPRLDIGEGFDITNPSAIIPIDIEGLSDAFFLSENRICNGLAFSPDGTILLANMTRLFDGTFREIVSKTTLDTPFTLPETYTGIKTTIPPQRSFDYSGLAFSPGGSRMFVVDTDANTLRQYTLPTAFTPSSLLSLEIELPLAPWTPGGTASNPVFSPNGRELFMISANSRIIHFRLNQAFNLTGGYTYVGSFNNPGNSIGSIRFNRQGTKMILLQGARTLKQYNLTTPFTITSGVEFVADLNLARYDGSFDDFIFPIESFFMDEMIFNNNGTQLMVVGRASIDPTPFAFVLKFPQVGFKESSSNDGSIEGSLRIEASNTFFDKTPGTDLTEGVDYIISNIPAGLTPKITVSSSSPSLAHLTLEGNAINNDIDGNVDNIEITLFPNAFVTPPVNLSIDSVPISFKRNASLAYGNGFDLTQAPVFVNTLSNIGNFGVNAIHLSEDGTKMYIIGDGNPLRQFDLSTPFDITTLSQTGTLNIDLSDRQSIVVSPDGRTLIVSGILTNIGPVLAQYRMTTPFNISTAVFEGFQENVPTFSPIRAMKFNYDGTRMYYYKDRLFNNEICTQDFIEPFNVLRIDLSAESICTEDFVTGPGNGTALYIDGSGTKVIILRRDDLDIPGSSQPAILYDFNLANKDDIESSTPLGFVTISPNLRTKALHFSRDGKKAYISNGNVGLSELDLHLATPFIETAGNNGIVAGAQRITLHGNQSFTNAGDILTHNSDYSISNLPEGLTPILTVDSSGIFATLTLTGSATNNEILDSVESLIFTFQDSAFSNNSATSILYANNYSSEISITFQNNPPQVICQDITVQLDIDGNATITVDDIDNGSSAASGIVSLDISKTDFTCDDVGDNTVTLTLVDNNGVSVSCTSTVTVEDVSEPNFFCLNTITVQLDTNGEASLNIDELDGISVSDACGIASAIFSQNMFTCDDIGSNAVSLTTTDVNGNTSTCNFTVIVSNAEAVNSPCPGSLITNTNPSNNQLNINTSSDIIISFNGSIESSRINNQNIVISGSQTGLITGNFSGQETNTITFNPNEDFKPGEIITVNITNDLVENPTTLSFTTIVPNTGNPANPSSTAYEITNTVDRPREIVLADINNDGALDVLSASSGDDAINLFVNDGNSPPSFSKQTISNIEDFVNSLAVGDIENDGDLDVISIALSSNQLVLHRNTGGGASPTFTRSVIDNNAIDGSNVKLADLNNDGHLDIISISSLNNDLNWYRNDGNSNPGFTKRGLSSVLPDVRSLVIGDINNDGFLDIAASVRSNETISWFRNSGAENPTFAQVIVATEPLTDAIALQDIDGDGDLDIAATTRVNGEIAWFENNGNTNPSFSKQSLYTNPSAIGLDIVINDIDGDGDMDIIASQRDANQIIYLENDGNTNPNFSLNSINNTIAFPGTLTLGDLDKNGTLDVVVTSETIDSIFWLETISTVLSVVDNELEKNITLYPNPAKNKVYLNNPNNLNLNTITIFDLVGRLVKTIDITSNGAETEMDISDMMSATYFLIIEGADGQITKKLIKE